MLQTEQRFGSAIRVAVVLAQVFERVAASRGQDCTEALAASPRTTVIFVVVALAEAPGLSPSTGSGNGWPFDRLRERVALRQAQGTGGPSTGSGCGGAQGTFLGTWRSLWVISSMETSRKVSTLALFTNLAGRYMSQTQASPIETS